MEDLTMFHKIEHGLINIKFPSDVIPSRTSNTRRSHDRQKAIIGISLDAYKHSYFIRTVSKWNHIPAGCAEAVSSTAFTAEMNKQM